MQNYQRDIDLLIIDILPITFLLIVIKGLTILKNSLNSEAYGYLTITVLTIISLLFLLGSFYIINHIIHNKMSTYEKCFNLLLLLGLNIVYIPYYFFTSIHPLKPSYCIASRFILLIMALLLLIPTNINSSISTIDRNESNEVNIKYTRYNSLNNLFTVLLNDNYVCSSDVGSYVIACDNEIDSSFIGIYSYKISNYSTKKLEEIYDFHLQQTISYIKEAGYLYYAVTTNNLTKIYYDGSKMEVLIEYNDYDVNGDNQNDYRLITINEFSNSKILESEFRSIHNSIEFIK